MTNRKKRLKKGLASIGKQIELHEEKKESAHEKGSLELEGYYGKEIQRLENARKIKKKLLEK